MSDLADGGPPVLRQAVLPQGQYGFLNDLRQVADGTPAGVVALAQKAGLRGILAKYNDGSSVVAGDGSGITWQANFRALAGPCRDAGISLIPWGYIYPPDRAALGQVVAQAMADSGQQFYILDAEIEFDQDPQGAQDAQDLILVIRQAAPDVRLGYTSWGWPDQHPNFPWQAFQIDCEVFLPQVYPALLQVSARYAWLRAFGGHAYAGGPNPGTGPQGFASLTPPKPVIPILDLSDIQGEASMIHNWSGPCAAWWVLDDITMNKVAELGGTPYAPLATQPPATPPPPTDWQKRAMAAEGKLAAIAKISAS